MLLSQRAQRGKLVAPHESKKNAKQTDRGDVITLGDMLFDSNRAELRSGSRRDLAKLVDDFKRHPKRTALIVGFTDK